jgi:hypothetical protein
MSPAGGGRTVEHFKLSIGGGLDVALNRPPLLCKNIYIVVLPPPAGDNEQPAMGIVSPWLMRLPT